MVSGVEPTRGINVYFSYAPTRKDKALRDELDKQLGMLKQLGYINSWHERQVELGKERKREIDTHLKQAQVVLLLISPDFIASDECYGAEMQLALKRHSMGEAVVVPIIIRPTANWKDGLFGKLQALPRDEKPVSTLRDRDTALVAIVNDIQVVIERMYGHQSANSSIGLVKCLPPDLPHVVQRREEVVQRIYARLTQPDTTAMVLTGIGGVGKSTLAKLVYHSAEEQRLAGKGPFSAEPLWIRINPAFTMTNLIRIVFEALDKPLPDFLNLASWGQEAVLWDQATILFDALHTTAKPRLVILDQFEVLLDPQIRQIRADRPGIGEWLDILNNQTCASRLLLTSRFCPRVLPDYPAGRIQEFPVNDLSTSEGKALLRNLLQAWDVRQSESELEVAVSNCGGHPLALELLASLLRSNRSLNITVLGSDPIYAQLWIGDMAQNLLDFIYKQQLNQVQRDLLLAFSVYREAVPLDAGQAIISSSAKLSTKQLLSALNVLRDQHLLQDAGNLRFRLHPVVASYAQDHFVEDDEQANHEATHIAHIAAAQYYQQRAAISCPPKELRHHLDDIHDLVEAIWHLCKAGQQQLAYELIRQESIFYDLQRWGGNTTLLELYKMLLPSSEWRPERLQAGHIYNELGVVYMMLGQKGEAHRYFETALSIFNETGQLEEQIDTLNNLGMVYRVFGQKEQALKYYRLALQICAEMGYPESVGTAMSLNNLGVISFDLGQREQALKYFEQSLPIYRKLRATGEEARTLMNLGRDYDALKQREEAHTRYQEALRIFQEIGDRGGQGNVLNHLGVHCRKIGKKEEAYKYHKQALRIFQEIGDRWEEAATLRNLGRLYLFQKYDEVALACFLLAKVIFEELQSPKNGEIPEWVISELRLRTGKDRFETFLAEVEPRALQILEQALHER